MKKAFALLCLSGMCTIYLSAQDLNGFWKGSFAMHGCFPDNNIELQITVRDGMVTGNSYHYQDINNYVKKNFRGLYDPSRRVLSLAEGIVTTYHIPQQCVICIKKFDLIYSREGNTEILRGNWGGHVINSVSDCGIGPIVLTRVKESAFKVIPEIKVDTGTIRLDFYDNAEIDGDSITVKVNNLVVLSHQLLGAKPITCYIKVDLSNTFQEVEMIAENLGSIPPNTAVLIITTGEKQHRISMSSTAEKSAKVRFVYEGETDRTASLSPLQTSR